MKPGDTRHLFIAILITTLVSGALVSVLQAQTLQPQSEVPGRLILELTEAGAQALAKGDLDIPIPPGGESLSPRLEPLFKNAPRSLRRFALLTFRADRAANPLSENGRWLSELGRSSLVQDAEADQVLSLSALPNDPYFGEGGGLPFQWHLHDPGGLSLNAPRAWPFVPAESEVLVAVIDSGVDWDHPDIGGSSPPGGLIRQNLAEVNGSPGVDDDSNGFVDDTIGWDFVDDVANIPMLPQEWLPIPAEDGTVADADPSDVLGHGTYITGLISALDRNGVGLAAAAPGIRILPVRVGWASRDGGGKVYMSWCAQGLLYAAQQGARVANCSWDSADLQGLGAALNEVINIHDMVVVGSAGNDNTTGISIQYLASRSDCLGVAGIWRWGAKGRFSNFGTWVDIAGFYKGMTSTWISGGTATYDSTTLEGTSWAAPQITALAAMLRAVDPQASGAAVRLSITSTGRDLIDVEPTYADRLGGGLADYAAAVRDLGGGWETPRPARALSLGGTMARGVILVGDGAVDQIQGASGGGVTGWETGVPVAGPIETAFLPLTSPWGGAPPLVVWGEAGSLRAFRDPGTLETGWPVALPSGSGQPVGATVLGTNAIYIPHGNGVLKLSPGGGGVDTATVGGALVSLAVSEADLDSTVLFAGDNGDGSVVLWTDGPLGPSTPESVKVGPLRTAPVIGEFEGPGIPLAVVAASDTLNPQTRQHIHFLDRSGVSVSYPAHTLDAPPIRHLSLGGFALGTSVKVVAVDSTHVLHLFAPEISGNPAVQSLDLGGPLTGQVLCADVNGDYQSDLLALRQDGTLLGLDANLSPLGGFPRHFPSGFLANPVLVDDGNRRYVVAADTSGVSWSLPLGPSGRPAPWPQEQGTPGRSGFLGHDRATPARAAVHRFTWTARGTSGDLCWSGTSLNALVHLRIRGEMGSLWEGAAQDEGCIGLAMEKGLVHLEGLTRTSGWISLASVTVGEPVFLPGNPYPNPFRAGTRLDMTGIPGAMEVQILDVRGRLVKRSRTQGERGFVEWDGLDEAGVAVSPGIYFIRVKTQSALVVRRVFKTP